MYSINPPKLMVKRVWSTTKISVLYCSNTVSSNQKHSMEVLTLPSRVCDYSLFNSMQSSNIIVNMIKSRQLNSNSCNTYILLIFWRIKWFYAYYLSIKYNFVYVFSDGWKCDAKWGRHHLSDKVSWLLT